MIVVGLDLKDVIWLKLALPALAISGLVLYGPGKHLAPIGAQGIFTKR